MRRPKNLKFKQELGVVKPLEQSNDQTNKENAATAPEQQVRGSILYRSIRRIKKIF